MFELTIEDNVATLVMDDGKVNAATGAVLDDLNAALDRVEEQGAALVLAGRPGVFSAGFDLKTMQGGDAAAQREMMRKGGRTVGRLFTFPIPVVAAITGHAFALGAVIALACDHGVCEEGDFKFALNETLVGQVFPVWGTEVIKTALTPKHLYAAGVLAKTFGTNEALDAGFFQEIAPAGQSVARAKALASGMSGFSKEAYFGNKLAFRGAAAERIRECLASY